jgi:hypothetical protein
MKFKKIVLVVLLGVGFLNPSLGETALTSFLVDPGPHDNGLWLVDPRNPQIYGSIGPKGVSSRWHIAQWGSKNPLSPDWRRYAINQAWYTKGQDGSTRVRTLKSYRGGRRVELMHSTLSPAFGCHTEFDLFLEPNDPTYSNYPQGFAHHNATPPLSAMKTLRLKAFQEVLHAYQGRRCAAPFDLAGTILAVVFINYHTNPNPPQTFFYQFNTYDSRLEDYPGWFFTGNYGGGFNNWGYSEYYDYYGYTELLPGRSGKIYDINIASRVKELISSAPGNLDRELSHWKVKGMYVGSMLNGEATIRSVVDSVDFLYE